MSADLFEMVRLTDLLGRTEGSPEVAIGLIDGPVAVDHPDLAGARLRVVDRRPAACSVPDAPACIHGTFVAGLLAARRDAAAPGICPGCTLLVCPVFPDRVAPAGALPAEVADAIHRCIDAGARILTLSAALSEPRMTSHLELRQALDRAARGGVLVVAAAGNDPVVASSVLTGHPWVVPVVGYDRRGIPMRRSTFGRSIGSTGVGAPGEAVTGLAADGGVTTLDGTSFATPFVSGAAALLWSQFPRATAGEIRRALLTGRRRTSIVPPLLDAESAYRALERSTHHVPQLTRE